MIVDFRKSKPDTVFPVQINGEDVGIVNVINYLGVTISHDLKWTINNQKIYKKYRQRMYFFRRLKVFKSVKKF